MITNTLDRETVPNYNLTITLQDTPSDGSQVNSNSFIVSLIIYESITHYMHNMTYIGNY